MLWLFITKYDYGVHMSEEALNKLQLQLQA